MHRCGRLELRLNNRCVVDIDLRHVVTHLLILAVLFIVVFLVHVVVVRIRQQLLQIQGAMKLADIVATCNVAD